jgi:hypothetical protein
MVNLRGYAICLLLAAGAPACSGQADECDPGDSMECECWPGGTYLGCGVFLSLAWAVFGRQECQSDGTWGACSCGEVRPECTSQPTAQCARWCDGISFSLIYDMPPGTDAAACEAAYLGLLACAPEDCLDPGAAACACPTEIAAMDLACLGHSASDGCHCP